MAKTGLKDYLIGVATIGSDGSVTYATPTKPGKAISCNVEVTNNDATLYADDAAAETDTSFAGGTMTMGIDREDNATMATLLGHTVSEGGELVRNINDVAPYVGVGRLIRLMVDGALKFRVEFVALVKFAEPSQENTTKGESTEFGTYELEGTIIAPQSGDWSKTQTFDTDTEALTYLNSCFAPVTPASS